MEGGVRQHKFTLIANLLQCIIAVGGSKSPGELSRSGCSWACLQGTVLVMVTDGRGVGALVGVRSTELAHGGWPHSWGLCPRLYKRRDSECEL